MYLSHDGGNQGEDQLFIATLEVRRPLSMRVSTINDVPFSTVSDGRRVMGIGAGITGWNAMSHSPPQGERRVSLHTG